jgi:hypothetical protein
MEHGQERESALTLWMQCRTVAEQRAAVKESGRRGERWQTISEELGPRVSLAVLSLRSLLESCVVGERPSAPLGRNNRAVRGDPCVLHAHYRARRERGGDCRCVLETEGAADIVHSASASGVPSRVLLSLVDTRDRCCSWPWQAPWRGWLAVSRVFSVHCASPSLQHPSSTF